MQIAITCTKEHVLAANNLKEAISNFYSPNDLPIVDLPQNADITIFFDQNKINLIIPKISNKPFNIDFAAYFAKFAKQNIKDHPLAQAIGLKNKQLTILDATAGFGKDTALLSHLGHKVIALEKNPIVFAMLTHANTQENISFINKDSYIYLKDIKTPPDIIYLDPMFPEKSKNNLVKKPMQILQTILSDSTDNPEELLQIARQKAKKKVIVKRPNKAMPLANLKPTITISKSQSTRYDIYLNNS